MVSWFDKQDQVIRILLLIPIWGWFVSGLYRVFKYVEGGKKSNLTLVIGILCFIPFLIVGFVISIVDLVTTITANQITFLAE